MNTTSSFLRVSLSPSQITVSSGAAKVTNLDADKLDGQEGSFYQNASNLNTGTVAPARLGSGTPNSTTFLRGDGVWAAPSGNSSGWADDGLVVRLTTATDKVGIGTTTPTAKLQVTNGDVYVKTVGTGLIFKSPNGSCFRLTVNNGRTLKATAITCP